MQSIFRSNTLLPILMLILILVFVYPYMNSHSEHEYFTNIEDPFDETYAKLYNRVFDDETIPKYDIDSILAIVGKKGKFLEAGSGVGNHYKHLFNLTKNPIGVDKSRSFIKMAQINNPLGKFINGELKHKSLFKQNEFDNILCLHDSFYHNSTKNMKSIISNFNYWLKNNGHVSIHLMDNEKLDPSPRMFSMIGHDKKGKIIATTKFKTFEHVARWGDDNSTYHEKFVMNNTGKVFTHSQKLNIPNKDIVIKMFLSNGFKVENIVDLISLKMNTCNIYVFKKI